VRQGLAIAAAGTVAGLAAAYLLVSFLTKLLFGVTPHDLTTFIVVPILIGLVTVAACILPARRAAAVDPIRALRT
jgi:ABC-type antimicrobial peptide transport system permease subunit